MIDGTSKNTAKKLVLDLEHLEKLGPGFREAIDNSRKEYHRAFSAIPFRYKNKRYIALLKCTADACIYDVERYGNF